MSVTTNVTTNVTSLLSALCAAIFLLCPGALIFQMHAWMASGEWPSLPVSLVLSWTGLDYPAIAWFDIQKLVDWLLAMPLSIVALPFGFLSLRLRTLQ